MKISFPHLANYHVPIERLLKNLFPHAEVIAPPPFTRRSIELGAKHSPDFVCMPFKYNLGNFIEAAQNGADVLFQGSGGCRYSYYTELQQAILHELGYEVRILNLFTKDFSTLDIYKRVKEIGCNLSYPKFLYFALLALRTIRAMDTIDFYIRENIGFESTAGSFECVQKRFLDDLKDVTTFSKLARLKQKYFKTFYSIPILKHENALKIGLVGELYSLMEPFSNFFIEKELAKNNIVIKRFTNATYLLFGKSKFEKKIPKAAGGIIKYKIGADGAESVIHMIELAKKGYDGIIHLKPFGCTPEINAMPILMKTAEKLNFPVLQLSLDTQSTETGIKTRLEAFYDMLQSKKKTDSRLQ